MAWRIGSRACWDVLGCRGESLAAFAGRLMGVQWFELDSGRHASVIPSAESPKNNQWCMGSSDARVAARGQGSFDVFEELKQRFLCFKNKKFLKEVDHFRNLTAAQSPKCMVIACVDSRVCPSNVLGFQPGEAFMVRNVANLVPPVKVRSTETSAALEFAVKVLKVENILVIGHSRCAGIEALMRMDGENPRDYIERWVINGSAAKQRTVAAASHLSFEQQCRCCETESVNQSLRNLLSYPWIEDRARRGSLSLVGGYYDFAECTFEKWRVGVDEDGGEEYVTRDHELWF
ncbi:hypothetical protein MLD38_034818 [Melastoma candidum]|uniref:Uncharacterized protein n=1 Tax=Melastoma candidum TaxID=119954 RepID=A0ACB9MD41_9MYRT|nr:hypothetical protein MLD38_034818 [Melastoma candidum]